MDRSVLYNIEPIGKGTPFVESLTSYITRLADAHCVLAGDLIMKLYAPLLNKEYLSKISKRGGNGFFDSATGINGLGKLANEFSQITNDFTTRTDISCTTLKNWSSILPTRGLLKATKSWCPNCYEEARINNEVIYEPLIWNFQLVNYCVKHMTPLVKICDSCKNTVPVINRKSVPGFCSRCGYWLGNISSQIEVLTESIDEAFTDIFIIGELLERTELDLSNTNPSNSVSFYVNKFYGSSPSRAAKSFEIPLTTFMMWMSGESIPSINYLVRMCKILGLSIIDFLEKQSPLFKPGSTNVFENGKKNYDHKEIRKILNKVIQDKQSISISEVAKMIGCDRKLLSKKYETECTQIKDNYNNFLQLKKKERFSLKNKQLHEAFYSLAIHAAQNRRCTTENENG